MSHGSDEPGRCMASAATQNADTLARDSAKGRKTGHGASYLIGGLRRRAADQRPPMETASRSGTRKRRWLVAGSFGVICALVSATLPAAPAWAAASPPVLHSATYVDSGVSLSYSDASAPAG